MSEPSLPAGSEADQLQRLADALSERPRSARRAVAQAEQQEADDRSMITRWVMRGFGLALLATFLLLVVQALVTGDWKNTMAQAIDILKSVILPVVTLVLGYYFGRAARGR